MALTEAQVRVFHEHGVVTVDGILTDEDFDPMIKTMSAFIDRRAQELKDEDKITNLFEDKPYLTRYAHIFAQSEDIGRGLDIYELRAKAVFDFLRNDHLLDAVESILGPDISCSPIQHIRAKPPSRLNGGPGFNVPWHQDSGVSWEESDRTLSLTCWVPLVDATIERGCMEMIPGVNHTGHLEHDAGGGTHIRPDLMPDTEPVAAEVKKGGVIFLSQYIPHRSTPNLSEWDVRWSLDLRYVAYGEPTGRPFYPDFCVRNRTNPDLVLTDHEEWARLWVDALEAQRQNPQHAHRV